MLWQSSHTKIAAMDTVEPGTEAIMRLIILHISLIGCGTFWHIRKAILLLDRPTHHKNQESQPTLTTLINTKTSSKTIKIAPRQFDVRKATKWITEPVNTEFMTLVLITINTLVKDKHLRAETHPERFFPFMGQLSTREFCHISHQFSTTPLSLGNNDDC